MQKLFLTKSIQALIFFFLLVPMLILNVRGYHFWSEDFARYAQQAVNIGGGKAFDASSYTYIPAFGSLIPVAPVGFSILLAPVVKIAGLNMFWLSLYLSFFFVTWMITSFFFFRKYFGVNTCLVILFTAFFPNFLLWSKLQIIADIPFSLLFLCACLLLSSNTLTRKNFVIAGSVTGLATVFSYAGFILFPIVWIYFGFTVFRAKNKTANQQSLTYSTADLGLFTITALAIYGLFSWVLFRPQHSYVTEALAIWNINTVWSNILVLGAGFLDVFGSTDLDLKIFSMIFAGSILAVTLLGFYLKIRKGSDLFDLVLGLYLFFILCFSEVKDYRLALPVHVILVSYLFFGLRFIAQKLKISKPLIAQLSFFGLILFVYADHTNYIWRRGKEILPGPYEPISKETFNYLHNNIPGDDIIVFNKPQTLALFTGKKTVMNNAMASAEENSKKFESMNVRYYLYNWNLPDNNYDSLIAYKAKDLKITYKNWQYTLYEDTTLTSSAKP